MARSKDGKELLKQLAVITRKLRKAEEDTAANREVFTELLKQCRKHDVSRGELAKVTGLTSARIWQITEGE